MTTVFTQLKPLSTPKSFSIPFSVILDALKSSSISSDEAKPNDFDAALIALSEGKFGDKAEEVAETLKKVFVVQNDCIPEEEKQNRMQDIDFALKDAQDCEEQVDNPLQIEHFIN